MNINDAFPSTYLKAEDLRGQRVAVQIGSVKMEEVGQGHDMEEKPVLYFNGKDRGLVLNKTNATTIASLYGPDTDQWRNNWITLFPTQTDFNGRQVACLRVEMQPPAQQNGQPPAAAPPKPEPAAEIPADLDIPF